PCQPGHCDIERVEILALVPRVDFDYERIGPAPATAHGFALELDALLLDGFHELDEGVRTHHGDVLCRIATEIHAPEPTAEGLFRKDLRPGAVGAQPHDRRHVPHVPAFLQHEH